MKQKEFELMILTPNSTFIYKNREYAADTFDKEEGLISLYDAYECEEPPKWVRYENVEPVNVKYKEPETDKKTEKESVTVEIREGMILRNDESGYLYTVIKSSVDNELYLHSYATSDILKLSLMTSEGWTCDNVKSYDDEAIVYKVRFGVEDGKVVDADGLLSLLDDELESVYNEGEYCNPEIKKLKMSVGEFIDKHFSPGTITNYRDRIADAYLNQGNTNEES